MKKAPPSRSKKKRFFFINILYLLFFFKILNNKVDRTAWMLLIDLYQYLVDCTTTTSAEVSRSLREALMQYSDLLMPPSNSTHTTNGLSSHC